MCVYNVFVWVSACEASPHKSIHVKADQIQTLHVVCFKKTHTHTHVQYMCEHRNTGKHIRYPGLEYSTDHLFKWPLNLNKRIHCVSSHALSYDLHCTGKSFHAHVVTNMQMKTRVRCWRGHQLCMSNILTTTVHVNWYATDYNVHISPHQ